jgi:3,4-dihydroxy 2-butanone 4-phosphate synthase/GTP cyclohydrolase II
MCRYSSIEAAIEAIAEGRVLIAVDSQERENEGDFLAAAELTTPAMIHFMVSQGRGQLCMPVSPRVAQRLDLTPMVACADLETPRFAIPVDHRECKTGISPLERASTIRAMLDPFSTPRDFVRPGHIFPLIAQEEGVLRRPGHTEAAVDLARLAGLAPAGVLCEICSRDGLHMACGQELWEIAHEFRLPVITIDDLIQFRRSLLGGQEEQLLVLNELAGL